MNISVSNKVKPTGGLVTPAEFSALQKISEAFSNLTAKLWPSTSQAYEAIEAVSFAIGGFDMGCISRLYIKIVLKIPGEEEKIDLPGYWEAPLGIVIFDNLHKERKSEAVASAPTINDVPLAIVDAIQKALKQKLELLEKRTVVYGKVITALVGLVLNEEMNLASSKSQKE